MNAQEEESKPYSHANAMRDLHLWGLERPRWQAEAIKRIVSNNSLDHADFDELEQICLQPNADVINSVDAKEAQHEAASECVCLTHIENPIGVNALAGDQCLRLSENGLTIVYGDNGSGKSGYVRILKHACRSRDEKLEILSDVNGECNEKQSANLRFKEGDLERSFVWSPNQSASPILRSVSIFDSRSANTHVEATNNVAYIPFPMRVLEALASACDEMKQRIETKIYNIQQQTPHTIKNPNLATDTPAGAFIEQISEHSNLETLELLTNLSEEEVRRLAVLDADLTQDPKKVIAKLSAVRKRFADQLSELLRIVSLASESNLNKIQDLKLRVETTARVSKAASEELFSASPLPDIGDQHWKALWEAARRYSDEVVYPQNSFPEIQSHNDLCVLCQQPLADEAAARMLTFEKFIKSTAKKEETDARFAYQNALDNLPETKIGLSLALSFSVLLKDELDDRQLSKDARRLIITSLWRLRALKKGEHTSTPIGELPTERFSKLVQELEQRISVLSADEDSEEWLALLADQRSLRDRRSLVDMKSDVVAEIQRLKQISALKKALKTTTKRAVTDKNKELSDKLVTDALRGRFAREVEKLNIGTMPIELTKVRDRSAQSFFRVDFVGLSGIPIGEILSEGEHRCVALAAFLAELVTSKDYSGIVFDDPMSSLDHLYRKNVAKRLVEEAAHRQVVVFTHDLGFLFELSREADAQETEVHYQNVRRKQNKPGYVVDEQPMKAKSAGQLANAIQSELKQLKGSFDNLSDVQRTIQAKGVMEQLREAWDQGIADFIHPVLGRFDSQVKGSSLYRLVVLTVGDVRTVTEARSRLSEDLHASPETLNPAEVTHGALVEEVKKLIAWNADMKMRQSKVVKPKITFV